ncbi:hypothetical protein BP6252_09844 [Coleophoma cylindrospora]|uniref:S-adenosyl-L-methionine-dependent methyltransferase n=1 Tax=Coleophoma cylindrospora TaxID=1849047 RepID=A0A3D8QWS5_9HELO|nr:hypothetical protein BP6252_09844 [Coleophoma cylindrospora]
MPEFLSDTLSATVGKGEDSSDHVDIGRLSIDDGLSNDDMTSSDDPVETHKLTTSAIGVGPDEHEHVKEHGRTYHAYKQGKYPLPNDQQEQNRLNLQHTMLTMLTHGKLYLSPLGDNPQHVLDLATGTAKQHPSAIVLGTDLSRIQPQSVPPNLRFEIKDAEDEWDFEQKFDFIHGRALVTCFTDPSHIVRQAYKSLAPGGYFELRDGVMPMEYMEDPPSDCALVKWNEYMVAGGAKAGRPVTNVKHYKRWMEESGFENVTEETYYLPTNPWPKGQYFKTISKWFQADVLPSLDGISMKMFSSLGWSADQIKAFLDDVRKDFQDPSLHAYLTV